MIDHPISVFFVTTTMRTAAFACFVSFLCTANHAIAFIRMHSRRRLEVSTTPCADSTLHSLSYESLPCFYLSRTNSRTRANQIMQSPGPRPLSHLFTNRDNNNNNSEKNNNSNSIERESRIKDKAFLQRAKHWVVIVDDEEAIPWPSATTSSKMVTKSLLVPTPMP